MIKKKFPSLVLATNNLHKIEEIKSILKKAGLKFPILTLNDFPKRRPVVEDRPTIEGNARKKAEHVARQTGCWALADDTGLFIDALKGKPGVYSARFAGPNCNYLDNNLKALRLLAKVPTRKRTAHFRTVAALALPKGKTFFSEGKITGRILNEMRGENGFGYDPVFYVPRFKKTLAQMNSAQKNSISHRARAFSKVPRLLRQALKSI
jgi:XTP/dITP diphosphohydrolase